jgi:hypothetical protein
MASRVARIPGVEGWTVGQVFTPIEQPDHCRLG